MLHFFQMKFLLVFLVTISSFSTTSGQAWYNTGWPSGASTPEPDTKRPTRRPTRRPSISTAHQTSPSWSTGRPTRRPSPTTQWNTRYPTTRYPTDATATDRWPTTPSSNGIGVGGGSVGGGGGEAISYPSEEDGSNHFFCGTSWEDANTNCAVHCPNGSGGCPFGMRCFGGMLRCDAGVGGVGGGTNDGPELASGGSSSFNGGNGGDNIFENGGGGNNGADGGGQGVIFASEASSVEAKENKNDGPNTGLIIGAVVGVLGVLAAVVAVLLVRNKKINGRKEATQTQSGNNDDGGETGQSPNKNEPQTNPPTDLPKAQSNSAATPNVIVTPAPPQTVSLSAPPPPTAPPNTSSTDNNATAVDTNPVISTDVQTIIGEDGARTVTTTTVWADGMKKIEERTYPALSV